MNKIFKHSKKIAYFYLLLLPAMLISCSGKKLGSEVGAATELLPYDSNIVVGIDLKKIQSSEFGQKMMKDLPPQANTFMKDAETAVLGFDMREVNKEPNFVAIIKGKIDQAAVLAQIAEEFKKTGGQPAAEEFEGIKLHAVPNDAQMAVAFLEKDVVFGNREKIKEVIQVNKDKAKSLEKNKPVMELIGNVDRSKMLWAVGLIPENLIPKQEGGAEGMANPLGTFSTVKAIDLSAGLDKGLDMSLGIITDKEEDAKKVQGMVDSYRTIFGTSLAFKNPSLGTAVNSIKSELKKNRLVLSMKLDQATLNDLSNKAKQAAPMMMPPPGAVGNPAPVQAPVAPTQAP